MSDFKKLFLSNPRLLLSETTVRNALKDIYLNETGMINVLVIAYSCIDVLEEMKREHDDLSLAKQQWSQRLQTEYYIREDMAIKAVNIWCELFSKQIAKKVDDEYRKIKEEEEKTRKEKEREFQKRAIFRESILKLIEDKDFTEAERQITIGEQQGLGDELLPFRVAIHQKRQEEKISCFVEEINEALDKKQYNQAEKIIATAEAQGYENFSVFKEQIIEYKKQQDQELRLLTEEKYNDYEQGIRMAAHILDYHPDSLQAKSWLQKHPRTTAIGIPRLHFRDGEDVCTISWEDDDPYTVYTVCKAEGRYPRDPYDGTVVCENNPNKKITDHLQNNSPGIILKYTIFAVRTLDKIWTRTDCPGEAIWLPEPENLQIELTKDDNNRNAVLIRWNNRPTGCALIRIERFSNDDAYSFPELTIDIDDTKQDCHYLDTSVNSRTKYRYCIKQIWQIGTKERSSTTVLREIRVD